MPEENAQPEATQPIVGAPPVVGQEAAPVAPPTDAAPPPPADTAARPDHIPEKFWDAATGAPRVEALAKSYAELEKRNSGLRDAHRAEFQKEVFGNRPETPEGYQIAPPEKMPAGVVMLDKFEPGMPLEEGKVYFAADATDPMWGKVQAIAHRAGLSQEEFSAEIVPLVAEAMGHRVATAEERALANREFEASLGENGPMRAEHLRGWLRGQVGEDKARAIAGSINSKAAVEAFEDLMIAAGGARFSSTATGAAAARQTEEELRTMMRDPRYESDPAYQKQVSEGWRKLYGGTDAGVPAPFARRYA